MMLISPDRHQDQPTYDCLWVQCWAFSSMPSSSVWRVLAGLQASRPVQTYENAVWVWCHLRICWSWLHIFQTFRSACNYIPTLLSCFYSTNTSYKFGPAIYSRFDCVYFTCYKNIPSYFCVFFSIQVWPLRSYRKTLKKCMKLVNQF